MRLKVYGLGLFEACMLTSEVVLLWVGDFNVLLNILTARQGLRHLSYCKDYRDVIGCGVGVWCGL